MKRVFLTLCFALCFITLVVVSNKNSREVTASAAAPPIQQIDNMPIVEDHPCAHLGTKQTPIEDRGPEVRQYLAASLKISVTMGSGSGTIVYYNPTDGYAYVQSCGHLWRGTMSPDNGSRRATRCKLTAWYHNQEKLPTEKTYDAEVLWYSNDRGQDSSLSRFKPDWQPEFFPVAPDDYPLPAGTHLHSCGCDGGKEVAHYDVEVVGERPAVSHDFDRFSLTWIARNLEWDDLVTKGNSPRPGRSGGGLMTTDGYYVGICWGTSDKSGNGIGLFTPLKTIRSMNQQNGYDWLNKVQHGLARKIPIIDHNNRQGEYRKDYIPLPNGR